MSAFAETLKKRPDVESVEADGDVYEVKDKDGESGFFQQKGKWIFASSNRDVLAHLPADPVKRSAICRNGSTWRRGSSRKTSPRIFARSFSIAAKSCSSRSGRIGASGLTVQLGPALAWAKLLLPGFIAKVNEAEDALWG